MIIRAAIAGAGLSGSYLHQLLSNRRLTGTRMLNFVGLYLDYFQVIRNIGKVHRRLKLLSV